MTTLLVGATGFLGSSVLPRLADGPLAILVRPGLARPPFPDGVEVRPGDLEDPDSLGRALRGIDTLVYCASMGFGQVPPLVRQLQTSSVQRVLFVSSAAIFTSLPAATRARRLEAEEAVRGSGLAWTLVRPTMIYGTGRDRNISRLIHFLHRWPVAPVVGRGNALQQPIYVEDLADAIATVLHSDATIERAYNLAGAAPLTYAELLRVTGAALGRRVRLVRLPLRALLAGARVARRVPGAPHVSSEQIMRLCENKSVDYGDAVRDFGFYSRTFAEGVKLEVFSLGLAPLKGDAPVASLRRLGG